MKHRILGVIGSRRKNGNTSYIVKSILDHIHENDFQKDLIYLSDYDIRACRGCNACEKTGICTINDDMKHIYPLILKSDIMVLGSPTYFYNVSADVKLFFDRCFALEFFHPDSRSVWMSANEVFKPKYAVTAAICEQKDKDSMGVTLDVMNATLSSLGYRVIDSLSILNCFHADDAGKIDTLKQQIDDAAKKIVQYCELKKSAEKAVDLLLKHYERAEHAL